MKNLKRNFTLLLALLVAFLSVSNSFAFFGRARRCGSGRAISSMFKKYKVNKMISLDKKIFTSHQISNGTKDTDEETDSNQNTNNTAKNSSSDTESTQRSSNRLDVPVVSQGHNECGPTSLAMVLNYYGEDINPDNSYMFSSYDWGTTIGELVDQAERMGYSSRIVSQASLEEAAACIDAGIPLVMNGRWEGRENGHFMVMTGYQRDTQGNIVSITVNDPAGGRQRSYNAQYFVDNFWTNRECTFIAVAPKGSQQERDLPDNRYDNMATSLAINQGASAIGHGIRDIFWPFSNGEFVGWRQWGNNIVRAPAKIFMGTLRVVTGAVGGALEWVGDRIGGRVGNAISGVGTAISKTVQTINRVARRVESFFRRLF